MISKVLEVYRKEGAGSVVKRTWLKAANALYRHNSAVWYARRLDKNVLESDRGVQGTFSPVLPQELVIWLRGQSSLGWAADPREIKTATVFDHQWTCWRIGGQIAGFCKVGGERVFIVDFERELALPQGTAYMSEIYVVPQMRRLGVGRGLLLSTMEHLTAHSFSHVACHIPESNVASTRLFTSLGFRSFGKIQFTRVLGVRAFSIRPEVMLMKMAESSF